MQFHPAPPEDQIKAMLTGCGLPVEDLDAERLEHFFGCTQEDQLCGIIGLEIYGSVALLRSLAIAENARGQGYGKQLVREAETYAANQGVRNIYLLTNTAATFFESVGYAVAARTSAPAAIRGTREFSSICPASAAFMVKEVPA